MPGTRLKGRPAIRSATAVHWIALTLLAAALAAPGLAAPARAQSAGAAAGAPVIGCALPLSGDDAAVGARALRGVLLAAGVFDKARAGSGGVVVAVRDTAGTSSGAASAVSQLAGDEKAVAIIGPVTSKESPGAAVTAQQLRVPIITLTQHEKILAPGEFVFRSLLTPKDEARAVAIYATRRLLITRFAVLGPADPFGRDLADAFAAEVAARGGRVTRRASYAGPFDIPRVLPELLDAEGGAAPWDAIFIPDGVFAARVAADRLRQAGVRNPRLLGTSLWNTPDATLGGALEGAVFAAPFSEADPRPRSRAFSAAYRRTFGEAPDALAAQAHDAAAFLIALLRTSGQTGPEHLRERMQVTTGIEGAAGKLRFEGGRDARRGAVLLTIRGARILPVAPAHRRARPAAGR